MKPPSLPFLQALILLSSILLALGLVAPSMTIVPEFGSLGGLLAVFKPELVRPESFSIVAGIWELLKSGLPGNIFVGLLLLLFSVLFPLWKLGVLHSSIGALRRGECPMRGLYLIDKLGKFSMIDIYVIALLVLAVKGLPGGSEVRINWGLCSFAVSILLTLKVPHWIAERAHDCAPSR